MSVFYRYLFIRFFQRSCLTFAEFQLFKFSSRLLLLNTL